MTSDLYVVGFLENDKDVCLIDSPCLDILPAIELFNYFTLKYPNNYLYLDPIGILNKYVSVDVDDELKKGGKSVLLLYFSSNRKKGLYHPKIYEFVSKYKHNNKIIAYDPYQGHTNYLRFSRQKFEKLYGVEIRDIYNFCNYKCYVSKLSNLNLLNLELIFEYIKYNIKMDLLKDIRDPNFNYFPYRFSIGCNYKCVFCSSQLDKWHSKDIDVVEQELIQLRSLNVNYLLIVDQFINSNLYYFNKVLNLLHKYEFKVHFVNGIGLNKITRPMIHKLTKVTDLLLLSPEAGSDHLLRLIRKPHSISKIERVFKMLPDSGLKIFAHYLYNIPGEKKMFVIDSFENIIRWYNSYKVIPRFQVFTPINKLYIDKVKFKKSIDFSFFGTKSSKKYYETLFKTFHLIKEKEKEKKLIVNLSYRCNNNCIFCSVADRERKDGDIRKQLKVLREFKEKGFSLLDIDGGEPFLSENVWILLDEASRLGYTRITITTNGRMFFYDKVVKNILKYDNVHILVSIHSICESTQNKLTRSDNSFYNTYVGIKNAVKILKDRIGINSIFTSINYSDLFRLYIWLNKIGIKFYNIQYYTPFGVVDNKLYPPGKSRKVLHRIIEHSKKSKVKVSLVNFRFCYDFALADYMTSDFFKSERYMMFVSGEVVNLFDFLSTRRKYIKKCLQCEYKILCRGYWDGEY